MKVFDKIKKPLIFIILAGLVVGYYIYLTNRPKNNTDITTNQNSAVSAVLARDLNLNYPGTARSVITYYCDILRVVYKETLTDDEFDGIVGKLQGLFDDELLALNDYPSYYASLAAEVSSYKEKEMYIGDYKVEENYNIEYKTLADQRKYAYVEVILYVRTSKKSTPIYEKFTLRQDDAGNWKMLTWVSEEASDWEKQP